MAGLRMLRRNLPLACLGLGIVRAVDVAEGRLLILTPVPLELLRHCTVLARGALQIPMVMMDLRSGGPNPYLSNEAVSGEGAAQLTQGRLNIARRRGGPTPAAGGGGD
jgi:polynucleotide 5'-hydroxyl-kinase GRC3/NOL9